MTAVPIPPKASSRIPELDLLRFVAASAVVLYHFTYRPPIHGIPNDTVFPLLQGMTRFGYLGVNLFFMISGFVILWSSQARTAGEFVISRIARLYPSFWVCVILTAAVVNLFGTDRISGSTVAANLTMLPSVLGFDYVDGVYWTLFVELKFYLLVFLVLVTRTMPHVEKWLALWLLVSLAGAFNLAPRIVTSLAMYPFGPYFISGCLLYLIRARGMSAFRGVALLIACVLAARYAIEQQSGFMQSVDTVSSWTVACLIVVFHIAFATVALRPRVLPDSPVWYWLGSLTYPLYLLHNRIGKTLYARLPEAMPIWATYVVLFGVIYLLSWLIAATVERRVCGAFQRAMTQRVSRWRVLKSSAA